MQRADINPAAKNICWLLLIERMNSQTGECFCTNEHIAEQLGIDLATVKRAKLQLLGKPSKKDRDDAVPAVLETFTAQNAPTKKRLASSYRFLRRLGAQNAPTARQNAPMAKKPQAQNAPIGKPKFHHKPCSPQYLAWETYKRSIGQSIPTNRNGWTFETEWPPGHPTERVTTERVSRRPSLTAWLADADDTTKH